MPTVCRECRHSPNISGTGSLLGGVQGPPLCHDCPSCLRGGGSLQGRLILRAKHTVCAHHGIFIFWAQHGIQHALGRADLSAAPAALVFMTHSARHAGVCHDGGVSPDDVQPLAQGWAAQARHCWTRTRLCPGEKVHDLPVFEPAQVWDCASVRQAECWGSCGAAEDAHLQHAACREAPCGDGRGNGSMSR